MSARTLILVLPILMVSVHLRGADPAYRIQLDVVSRGYDGKTCWVHPRAGTIPGENPSVVLTMQKLLLTGSDVFFALNEMRTDDLGKTWSGPLPVPNPLRNDSRARHFHKSLRQWHLAISSCFRSPRNRNQPSTKLAAAG
jgi:hypothetical protein